MDVVKEMGKIIILRNQILNIDTLESGNKIIWCDHTINNIKKRAEENYQDDLL
jgi:hypothetical protein